jgi:enoyl-CoA hydratase/carnithine racemase
MGLVNRSVPPLELDAFVDSWARRLATGATAALSLTKTMLNNSFGSSLDQALEDETRSQSLNYTTEDWAESIEAFFEKRPPNYIGR